jgi:hypothetical protein
VAEAFVDINICPYYSVEKLCITLLIMELASGMTRQWLRFQLFINVFPNNLQPLYLIDIEIVVFVFNISTPI